MNAVGIDVSKGKSMIAVLRPYGEVVISPFEVRHTADELNSLAMQLKSLPGETRVVMECTGTYYQPIAYALHDAGLFVSVVHPQLIHRFGNNTIRRVKTDKADALKIANYGLLHWLELPGYTPEEDVRRMLKIFSRQYDKYTTMKVSFKNNFVSLTDQTFPGVNELFSSPARESDGHEKWVDFAAEFWHCECVCGLSQNAFTQRYQRWCKRHGYHFQQSKAGDIYVAACGHVSVVAKSDAIKILVTQAAIQINTISEALASIAHEMKRLAEMLPEAQIVSSFYGTGGISSALSLSPPFRNRMEKPMLRAR